MSEGRPKLLEEPELQSFLNNLKGWERDGKLLRTERAFQDFSSAMGFANAVALHAQGMDHHPDILVYGWNKVRLELSTHDQGGLTKLDFELADRINSIGL